MFHKKSEHKKKLSEELKERVRVEYQEAKLNGEDPLVWLNGKALELGMSYGSLVHWAKL